MNAFELSSLQEPDDNAYASRQHPLPQSDESDSPLPVTRSTMIFVFCAALNSCNLGYDIGVSTNVSKLVQEDFHLSDIQREVFVGFINFWAIFGALLAHIFTDRYGRRTTFVVSAIGFILGLLSMVFASTYEVLLAGRALVGVGVGIGLAIDPLYIAEISPARHRGRLVTYSEIALNVGIVVGFASGLILSPFSDNTTEWRSMLAVGMILPIFMMFLICFKVMPESPRWLVSKNRLNDASNVLRLVYPTGYDIDQIIDEISSSIELENIVEMNGIGWSSLLCPTPAIRRMLVVGVGTAIAQQAVGIDAIQYYLVDLIENLGISPNSVECSLILIFLGSIKLFMIFVGGVLFDSCGRRPLFFASLSGMFASLIVIAIAFLFNGSSLSLSSSILVICGIALYLSFFSIGLGPGSWLIPSEVFSLSIRGKAMSIATLCNRITATLMSTTFLSTVGKIGWSAFFFILALVCGIVLLLLFIYLPETKGRSLDYMAQYFADITGDANILEAEANLQKMSGEVFSSSRSS